MSEKEISMKDEQIAKLAKQVKLLQQQLASIPKEESKEQPKESRGILQVEVVEAQLDRSTEMWGKQDPFAELSIRLQKFKTKTHTDGAKAPVWNETTTMDVLDPSEVMKVKVFDEDMTSSDLICEGDIDLAGLCQNNMSVDDWFPLQFNGKQSGKIHLRTKYMNQ